MHPRRAPRATNSPRSPNGNPMTVEPLLVEMSDEDSHAPEITPLWNESWYFDFVDPQQGIGGWIRLGLMPNEDVAWINALVSGPDMPTIAVLDFAAALPPDPGQVRTDTIELTLQTLSPLREFQVAVRGRGKEHHDPGALLQAESGGDDVSLAMDLTWTTVGTPYQYRLTPRYEIPCTASGTVTFGQKVITLDAAPGQRDHSWGARDWWGGLEWMWCALHLNDGTHINAVDARVPGAPNVAMGYLQQPGLPVVELQSVAVQELFTDNGLPVSATIDFESGAVVAAIEIGGQAPVRLVSASGQVSHFPRAWVTVTTTDGRTGVGWIEWNRVQ